jgi:hypothetical protein
MERERDEADIRMGLDADDEADAEAGNSQAVGSKDRFV